MNTGGISGQHLRSFIERIERLEEEKKALAEDMKDVYAEAKTAGYDTKIMREVIKLRKLEAHERQEAEALLDTYMHAIEGGDVIPDISKGGAAAIPPDQLDSEGE